MIEFFTMGGYGAFIWPAYILFVGVQLVLAIMSWRWQRQVGREVTKIKAARDGSGQSSQIKSTQLEHSQVEVE